MNALDILTEARRIVAHPGWWKTGDLCSGGAVCAMGAIGVAAGVIPATEVKRKGKTVLEFNIEAFAKLADKILDDGDGPRYGWIALDYDGDAATDALEEIVNSDFSPALSQAVSILGGVIAAKTGYTSGPSSCIVIFNDSPNRQQQDVVAMFDRAIDKLVAANA